MPFSQRSLKAVSRELEGQAKATVETFPVPFKKISSYNEPRLLENKIFEHRVLSLRGFNVTAV